MDARIAGVLGFVTGAVCGGAGAYYILKKYADKRIEDEVEEVKEYYHDREERDDSEKMGATHEDSIPEEKEEPVQRNVKVNNAVVEPDYDEIINKLNYNKYSTTDTSGLNPNPYLISKDMYDNEGREYDKVMASWFTEDETLMDSTTDAIVDDVDKHVGYLNLEMFGKCEGADEDELYVRNEKLGIDYFIVMESSSYSDYIATKGDFPEE